MPGRTLPTILQADLQSRNTAKSCYVTIGTNVYDITSFLDDHPGGGDLILEYGGKDVTEIMKDEISHGHSEAAYEILDEHLVGFVATDAVMKVAIESHRLDDILPLPPTNDGLKELRLSDAVNAVPTKPIYTTTGMSSAEDLSIETDLTSDYRTHKFLDLNRPLLMQ
ncbi:MAG: fatty acid alpha-hydroxylase, partial [Pleopsidium flavum]